MLKKSNQIKRLYKNLLLNNSNLNFNQRRKNQLNKMIQTVKMKIKCQNLNNLLKKKLRI